MPRKKPGEAPKKRGRPRKEQGTTMGRPRKKTYTPRKTDSTVIIGNPLSKPAPRGSSEYRTAIAKIHRAERFWGVNTARSTDSEAWEDALSDPESDDAFRDRLLAGRSTPESVTVTTEKALGELGNSSKETSAGKTVVPPIRDRPLSALVGPGVPAGITGFVARQRYTPHDRRTAASVDTGMSMPVDAGMPAEGPVLTAEARASRTGPRPTDPRPQLTPITPTKPDPSDTLRAMTPPTVARRAVPPTLVTFPGPVRTSAVIPAHMVSDQFRPAAPTQVPAVREQPSRVIRSSRVDPHQARDEDATVFERLIALQDSIRNMMEDTGAGRYTPPSGPPGRVVTPEMKQRAESHAADIRARTGDNSMRTWVDEDIKKAHAEAMAKKAEEDAAMRAASADAPAKESSFKTPPGPAPKRKGKGKNVVEVEPTEKEIADLNAARDRAWEKRMARKAAEEDMRKAGF